MYPKKEKYSQPKGKNYLNGVKEHRVKERTMVFGIRAVMEAVGAGKEFDRILIRRDMGSAIGKQLEEMLKESKMVVQRVPLEKLNRITEKNHQGAIGFLSEISYQKIEDIVPQVYESGKTPLIVVLDGVTDVRNFGAIARTCECAGVDAIVLPFRGNVSVNADAIKTSAGALHHIPICRVDNLETVLQFLADSGIQIVAASEKSKKLYTKCDFTVPTAIVMGAEDVGLSPQSLNMSHQQVRIPIVGKVESLNVSVSAGILIYEVLRQRG